MKHVLIAGASGYVGQALISELLQDEELYLYGLSRSKSGQSEHPRLQWLKCDLFSLKAFEEVLPAKVDFAIYLIHSMVPTAALDQGSFSDYDLLLADNFSRGIKDREVKQIIYLGGLIPESQEDLSAHLKSRLEVERLFQNHELPLTILRAGLIVGEKGSSFQMLLKLVKRLPVLICPKWTLNLSAPTSLDFVLKTFRNILGKQNTIGKQYDLGDAHSLSYLEMMRITAKKLRRKRWFVPVPFFTPTLSRWWVALVTRTPTNLVFPLIESLKHPMTINPERLPPFDHELKDYADILENVSLDTMPGKKIFRFQPQSKSVRSVQRLTLPKSWTAKEVMEAYLSFLPSFFKTFLLIKVDPNTQKIYFRIRGLNIDLLVLKYSESRSSKHRQLLYIKKGLLVAKNNTGRLEFRTLVSQGIVLCAIHEFRPSLPWYLYKWTQAKAHLWTMNNFDAHLKAQSKQ